MIPVIAASWITFAFRLFRQSKQEKKKRLILFGGITAPGFLTVIILVLVPIMEFSHGLQIFITGILSVSFHIPGIFILRNHLFYDRISGPESGTEDLDLETFGAEYKLTLREREILEIILKGKGNREIGELLFISLDTVKKHVYHIYRKTGVKKRMQLLYLYKNSPK
jgi:DNA-binding CsgD family transcriptional regulator